MIQTVQQRSVYVMRLWTQKISQRLKLAFSIKEGLSSGGSY